MSNFLRILNMASKALDKKGQSPSPGAGKSDWRDLVRTAADSLAGDGRPAAPVSGQAAVPAPAAAPAPRAQNAPVQTISSEDRAAIARYDYLLKTAQPEQLEQVHRDAFARLTLAQREQVGAELRAGLPVGEQPVSTGPEDLARSATRGEAHNPGFLRTIFAKPTGRGAAGALAGVGVGAAAGVGVGAAGGLLAAVAGGALLSSVAAPLLEQAAGVGVDFESLAGGLNLDGLTGGLEGVTGGLEGLTGGLESLTGGAGDAVAGLGEQITGIGSNFEIPGLGGLGDLFGR